MRTPVEFVLFGGGRKSSETVERGNSNACAIVYIYIHRAKKINLGALVSEAGSPWQELLLAMS